MHNACATDMTPERNALMEHAYPQLKEYCRTKYRFEFQVTYGHLTLRFSLHGAA